MVKRSRDISASDIDRSDSQDKAAILTSFKEVLSAGRTHSAENRSNDDLIVVLGDAYENRRARQVSEWQNRQHFSSITRI